MAKQTNMLRKMYLFSEGSVQKLKELDEAEKEFTELDKRMRKILYDKKLAGHTKWLLYNNLLQKYNNLRRKMSNAYNMEKAQLAEATDKSKKSISPEKSSVAQNPFDANIHDNIPDFQELDFSSEFEQRNNSEFFNNLEHRLSGNGELETLSPNSSRRLSAASTAAEARKSAIPFRHHLMNEPSFIRDDSRNLTNPNMTILEEDSDIEAEIEHEKKKKKNERKNSVSLLINDHVYSIHKDDEDDFREFAAEEFTKYPEQDKLLNSRFQMYKKRKNKEFQDQLEAEKILVEAEKQKNKKRKEELEIQKKREENRKSANQKQLSEDQLAHWSGMDETVGTKKQKTQVTKAVKKERLSQPSVANAYPKVKNTRSNTRALAASTQKGRGKNTRWFRMM